MAPKRKKLDDNNEYPGGNTASRFTLIKKFLGYRSREDKTLLNPAYMIDGSHDVLIDISGRLKTRLGYTLDGQANTTLYGITSAYDWEEHLNSQINLRSYDGNVQFRYVDSAGTVAWTTILTGLTSANPVRYTNYWDNGEKINVLLFVAGSSFVYEWNGATTTVASVTANTITTQGTIGTTTWGSLGFYTTANKQIVINGITYTYTGGESTMTLTGVTPDPTLGGITAGMLAYQKPVTTANASITSMLSTFRNDLISNVQQQIYYGSTISNSVYISVVNNYKSVAFTTPVRVTGEGALLSLRGPTVAFAPQENYMYISAGDSQWYQTTKTLSADLTKENFDVVALKLSAKQGSFRQEATVHDRNSVVYISNESRMDSLGRIDNIYQTPMIVDYSYPVAADFNGFDFTGASMKYWKSYVYIAIPMENLYYILNQTDLNNVFWEAPQTGAFSGFSIIDGELFAHDFSVPQTYKLYDGYNDNGNAIHSIAQFAYNDFGVRGQSLYYNEFWIDGYISANTKLTVKYNYDLDGCATVMTNTIDGNNNQVVCIIPGDASLGKASLGKHGLGTNSQVTGPIPPYFNAIITSPRKDFYRVSPSFESYGTDFRWELLAFGPLVTQTMFGSNNLKS